MKAHGEDYPIRTRLSRPAFSKSAVPIILRAEVGTSDFPAGAMNTATRIPNKGQVTIPISVRLKASLIRPQRAGTRTSSHDRQRTAGSVSQAPFCGQ